jgi:hypothetical protein
MEGGNRSFIPRRLETADRLEPLELEGCLPTEIVEHCPGRGGSFDVHGGGLPRGVGPQTVAR